MALINAYLLETLTTDSVWGNTFTNNNSVTNTPWVLNSSANFWTSNTNKSLSTATKWFNLSWTSVTNTMSILVKVNTEIWSWNQWFISNYDKDSKTGTTPSALLCIMYDYNSWTRRLWFRHIRDNVWWNDVYYTITLWTIKWYHLTIWVSAPANVTEGWINWVSIWSTTYSTADNGSPSWVNRSTIGRAWNDDTYCASVNIDDVRIYNTKLAYAEVKNLTTYYRWFYS